MARSGGTYRPGTSGNPKGRPKGSYSVDKLIFANLLERNRDKRLKHLGDVLYSMAEKGDIKAITLLLERAYGKARQQVEVVAPEETVADYMARLVTSETRPKNEPAGNVERPEPVQRRMAQPARVLAKTDRSHKRAKKRAKDNLDTQR